MQDIHKSYFLSNGEEIPVLKGIDLDIEKGEFVALM
jgi:ABC-type lipoprotein export system ATPase subunit